MNGEDLDAHELASNISSSASARSTARTPSSNTVDYNYDGKAANEKDQGLLLSLSRLGKSCNLIAG